jgi:hypothetical protein
MVEKPRIYKRYLEILIYIHIVRDEGEREI